MTKNSLIVTLDGLGIGDTVLVEDLKRVLDGVSTAMRLMVGHLGGREPGPGQLRLGCAGAESASHASDASRLLRCGVHPRAIG